MFAIVISEKGGTERREVFDRDEINVGRVQGNELMLPKGNVSKRHARLLFREGRFIVTDLKSTNGTYVNGRKIAQATIVREGDKIYVGDFVLRVELSRPDDASRDAHPTGEHAAHSPASQRAGLGARGSSTTLAGEAARAATNELPTGEAASPGRHGSSGEIPRFPLDEEHAAPPSRGGAPAGAPPHPEPPRMSSQPPSAPVVPASRPGAHERPRSPLRALFAMLVGRATSALGLSSSDPIWPNDATFVARVEETLRAEADALEAEGAIASDADKSALVRAALAEMTDVGVVGDLLDDPEIDEIHVLRHDHVVAVRVGGETVVEQGFSSPMAVLRALARLCESAGRPLEPDASVVERELAGGHLFALAGPSAATGPVLVVRKLRRVDASLEDLVRSGTLSRGVATFLQHAVAGRANVLVACADPEGASALVGALARTPSHDDRVVVVRGEEHPIAVPTGAVELVGADPVEAIATASRLRAHRLVVPHADAATLAAILEAISGGLQGVVAAIAVPTLRQALERLPPALASRRPPLDTEAAREWIVASFDLAVELARLPDGRYRVLRVTELSRGHSGVVTHDVFQFVVERHAAGGAIEGAFLASGHVPRIAEDFAARGAPFDSAVFHRTAR